METKELKITIPEGFEIDKENSSFEKIVFKKKDTKPRSWEEYYQLQEKSNAAGYFINSYSDISKTEYKLGTINELRNTLPTKELAEAFLAMMQLMSLRQAWIGDWKPDWCDNIIIKWCIVYQWSKFRVFECGMTSRSLSFPTREMAEDFMNCFKDLLEIAKPLI